MFKAIMRLLSMVVSLFQTPKSNANAQSAIKDTNRPALKIQSVASSIVGTYHAEQGKPCEDIYGDVESDGKSAFFVVDGAGGESNGRIAAVMISRIFKEFLPTALILMTDEESIRQQLAEIFLVANNAALQAGGRATLVLFISLPNGTWGLLQVGDAIFLGEDAEGFWQMPVVPLKYSNSMGTSRNCTSLLGTRKIEQIQPHYASGVSSFYKFLLSSDWLCGSERDALVYDTRPNAIIGSYQVNQGSLRNALVRLNSGSTLISAFSLQEYLFEIQRGETHLPVSNDDMTIIYGVIDGS